ncbi:MAG: beta-aspartyl-peptidase [Treponema sp.]|nr:beta-aspartyl-peptidase [Treponema sp.]
MILIKNANVYEPQPLGKKDVLISFDRILQIGEDLAANMPDIETIDASGKTLAPGFFDQHVHVTGGGGEGGLHSRVPELTLGDVIASGVTSLVGVLGTDSYTRSVETLVAKTKALNSEGISAYCLTGAYRYPPPALTGSVAQDIIFISEILGCKIALSDHRGSHPAREELIRLVSEVRVASLVAGKPGVLHMHIGADPAGIEPVMDIIRTTDIPVRHFRPTHMGRHPKQAIEFMRMGGYADFTANEKLADLLADIMNEANVNLITVSSDSNGSMPRWDDKHEKITGMGIGKMTDLYKVIKELIIRHNVPIEKALSLITRNTAKALELYPRKGAVQKGSDADIVLLDSSMDVDTVIARGRIMMRDKNIMVKGMFEE